MEKKEAKHEMLNEINYAVLLFVLLACSLKRSLSFVWEHFFFVVVLFQETYDIKYAKLTFINFVVSYL